VLAVSVPRTRLHALRCLRRSHEEGEELRVYVAGPITHGDTLVNARVAFAAATELMGNGFQPFVPHSCYLMHMHAPQTYERWMEYDFAFLKVCHALLRLPGHSPGADREVEFAKQMGIPVFFDMEPLVNELMSKVV